MTKQEKEKYKEIQGIEDFTNADVKVKHNCYTVVSNFSLVSLAAKVKRQMMRCIIFLSNERQEVSSTRTALVLLAFSEDRHP